MAEQQFPAGDTQYIAWLLNLASVAAANQVALKLTLAQADALGQAQGDLALAYDNHVAARATSKQKTQEKEDLKKSSQVLVRGIIKTILNDPTIPDSLKEALGLRPHDTVRSPVAPPTTTVTVQPGAFIGATLAVRLVPSEDPLRRAKPDGVANYQVFAFVGATPPADLAQWRLAAVTGRDRADVAFAPADRGQPAWIVARAVNAKGEPGPAGAPVSVIVAAALAA